MGSSQDMGYRRPNSLHYIRSLHLSVKLRWSLRWVCLCAKVFHCMIIHIIIHIIHPILYIHLYTNCAYYTPIKGGCSSIRIYQFGFPSIIGMDHHTTYIAMSLAFWHVCILVVGLRSPSSHVPHSIQGGNWPKPTSHSFDHYQICQAVLQCTVYPMTFLRRHQLRGLSHQPSWCSPSGFVQK